MCKKTNGPTGGRWVGHWWVGPKGGIAGVSLSRRLQTTGQYSGVQLFNSQSFDPNLKFSTQVNFNRVGLYRLNSVRSNHRPHRPNRVIPTSHWLPVWPKGVIAGVSLISVVTQLNFNRVGLYENKRRCRLGYHHCHVPLSSPAELDSHNNLIFVFIFIACHHIYARY